MGELENLVADIGVKQWVKNKFLAKLREWSEAGNTDTDTLLQELNDEILRDFKVIVNESISEVTEKATRLMKEAKSKA